MFNNLERMILKKKNPFQRIFDGNNKKNINLSATFIAINCAFYMGSFLIYLYVFAHTVQ